MSDQGKIFGRGLEDSRDLQRRVNELLDLMFRCARDGSTPRSSCGYCGLPIGLREMECTGWHPDFKCACGYEAVGPIGVICRRRKQCPACGRDAVLSAEFVLEDILDAEVIE